MRKPISSILSLAGLAAGSMLWTTTAKAQEFVLGVDVEYVRTTSDITIRDATLSDTDNGVEGSAEADTSNGGGRDGLGLHGRAGYQVSGGLIYLRPEVGGQVVFFDERRDYRAYGGGRLGLLTGLSPGVFAHIGHGWYGDERGLTGDVGGTLDLTIFPNLSVGAHASYVFNPENVPNWVTLGAHLELAF